MKNLLIVLLILFLFSCSSDSGIHKRKISSKLNKSFKAEMHDNKLVKKELETTLKTFYDIDGYTTHELYLFLSQSTKDLYEEMVKDGYMVYDRHVGDTITVDGSHSIYGDKVPEPLKEGKNYRYGDDGKLESLLVKKGDTLFVYEQSGLLTQINIFNDDDTHAEYIDPLMENVRVFDRVINEYGYTTYESVITKEYPNEESRKSMSEIELEFKLSEIQYANIHEYEYEYY